MSDTIAESLWEQVRLGRHAAVIGRGVVEAPAAWPPMILRVRCDHPEKELAPILEARRLIEAALRDSLIDQAKDRVVIELRRRLLGDLREGAPADGLVDVGNRLSHQENRAAVLIFEEVDRADPQTLALLRRVLGVPGRLQLPVVLGFRREPSSGPAAQLLDAMERAGGLVVRLEPPAATEAAAEGQAPARAELPADVMRVLRAAAALGDAFDVEEVAALLGDEPIVVLERLQVAADRGLAIDDDGAMGMRLPAEVARALRRTLLPSLARTLRVLRDERRTEPAPTMERTAAAPAADREPEAFAAPAMEEEPEGGFAAPAMPEEPERPAPPMQAEPAAPAMAGEPEPAMAAPEGEPEPAAAAPAMAGEREPAMAAPAMEREPEAASSPRHVERAPAPSFEQELAALKQAAGLPTEPPPTRPEPQEPWPAETRSPREIPVKRAEPAPAVRFEAARVESASDSVVRRRAQAQVELEPFVERRLVAARKAEEVGAYGEAIAILRGVIGSADGRRVDAATRLLRARLLGEIGRLQWVGAGPDDDFTLAGALEALFAAQAHLDEHDPVKLRAHLSVLIANVCYDIGDMPSLERALDELTQASRALLASGDSYGAARLLNDQAAVYVRMGDPVRASHLLEESRKVFEERADMDPAALAEVAQTDHLLARIPLHVPARPGLEQEAIAAALRHARVAEGAFRRLRSTRDVSRVWETMGRLEIRAGEPAKAIEHLSAALRVQEAMGDAVGLARTTAALADALEGSGRYEDALGLLSDSVRLNLAKGSPLGLAFNRRSLDALAAGAASDPRATAMLREVARQVGAAESTLGRIHLPGEAG